MAAILYRLRFVKFLSKHGVNSLFTRSFWSSYWQREQTRHSKVCILWSRLRHNWYSTLTLPPALAFSLFSSSQVETQPVKPVTPQLSEEELALEKADELFDNDAIDELYNLLVAYKDSKNASTQWRLARAARNKAERSKDAKEKKEFTYEALEHAKKALELNGQEFACHKWYAIALSNVGDYEGTRAKIENAYTIKNHFQKAIDLNPTDSTSRYLLGLWCFTFADMPWYQHKIAAAIFSTPPSSSYDEALSHFEMAESLEANFFSKNHLMIGKTYARLKNKEKAKHWLDKAANCVCKTVDDEQAKQEADELLKTL